jgi:hypothetical protein
MTLTEKYNEYVKECIKERPSFSGPYEDYYLEFDEWIYNYMTEFTEWCDNDYFRMGTTNIWSHTTDWEDNLKFTTKELLEIFKKEKGL